ncbi:bifunctional folylpolyglutamate synthase/dihydrofolate synthase [Candidatus Poriferisocius sp.]|uniref:bifunctional folylpolyglutamate synthase/dihydrofolate synthase n=1 Tax=Candidatus Poriferisocius sp. TaxID=3101276 RepID=UPI003B5ABAA9
MSPPPGSSLAEARAWLDGHVNLEATAGDTEGLSLQPMRSLLAALGEPHADYPAVHITGTNGKGSVATMVAALAEAWGMTVGTYASPHVERINERMSVGGTPIGDEDLAEVLHHLRLVEGYVIAGGTGVIAGGTGVTAGGTGVTSGGEGPVPSWFELVTAAAFRWFADVAVDLAVVEVGKLGRYDATNVVNSRVGVITNIGRDHTDGRPGWERAVMEEKAGILHDQAVAVLGPMAPELVAIAQQESPRELLVAGRHFELEENRPAVGGRVVTVRTPRARYEDVYVSLFGAHQGDNAALALTAFEALVDQELDESVLAGMGGVAIPARFEVVGRQPLVVIDGAHNPDGLAAAAATLAEQFSVLGTVTWVVGMMGDKDPDAMLAAIDTSDARCDRVVGCAPDWPRALPAAAVAAAATNRGIDAEIAGQVGEAVDRALALSADEDAVVIAGSLYTAGAARLHMLSGNS